MSFLKLVSIEHHDMLKRSQLVEKAALKCLNTKKNLSKEDYLKIVDPSKILFTTGLAVHFKFEEIAIFPIIMEKSKEAEKTVRVLVSDHSMILQRFREFEAIEDYDLSIHVLSGLTKDLAFHAQKEDNFFKSIHLSKEEATKIDNVVRDFGYPLS